MADRTAEDLLVKAIEVLQGTLPPGGVDDRETISRLWEVLDSPAATEIYCRRHPEQRRVTT